MTRLEKLRVDALLSRRDLADKTGVNHETIRSLEARRVANPQINTLRALSEFFSVPASELLRPAFDGSPDPEDIAA